MVEARNIAFSYRGREVLKDVSFVCSPGEIVCIVGSNGSGKTTLMRVLSTLLIPDGGKFLVGGKDAFERPRNYCRKVGYMPEKCELYEEMTVREYLTYRTKLKGENFKRIRRRVGEAIEMCHLSGEMNSTIRRLSEGMKRRVSLADAILLRPQILLLDDLLAGLDAEIRQAMGPVLSAAAAFSAVIVTGHEIADFAKWATRFLVLRDGVISSVIETSGAQAGDVVERLQQVLAGGER